MSLCPSSKPLAACCYLLLSSSPGVGVMRHQEHCPPNALGSSMTSNAPGSPTSGTGGRMPASFLPMPLLSTKGTEPLHFPFHLHFPQKFCVCLFVWLFVQALRKVMVWGLLGWEQVMRKEGSWVSVRPFSHLGHARITVGRLADPYYWSGLLFQGAAGCRHWAANRPSYLWTDSSFCVQLQVTDHFNVLHYFPSLLCGENQYET